jgi:DNA modification methylase
MEPQTIENIKSTPRFAAMAVEYISMALLKPYSRQMRRHTPSKIKRLAKFLERSGIILPLVIDQDNFVILGNARMAALLLLGVESVPVIRVTHLDETMIRSLILADNQFTINANWYKEALREELLYLAPRILELGLELIDLGFETGQLDITIGDVDLSGPGEQERAAPDGPAVTRAGYIWILGQHKLICGDARDEKNYQLLLGTELAAMVFADLPYNVPIDGHVCGNGAIQHREFAMASGEMMPEEFIFFMTTIFTLLRKFSKEGSVHMQCMDWRHNFEIMMASREAGYDYLNMAVWAKHAGGMGSLYRSQHELVHIFKSGTAAHINNIMLGKFGRNRTNVWNYEGANSFSAARSGDLALHSTTKPVDMIADAIKDCSNRGDIILDPTAGSGSVLIAAVRTGRIARLIEIDPLYCDVIVRRWQDATGQKAVLADMDQSFDALAGKAGGKND